MKYTADYQYLPSGATRPRDDGEVVGIEADDSTFALLPNVGDFVTIAATKNYADFDGRVRSRLFSYTRTDNETYCHINIVVEEADPAIWAALIKS